jgi:hypothetical protein
MACTHYQAKTGTGWLVHTIRHKHYPGGLCTISSTSRSRVACAQYPAQTETAWLVHNIRHKHYPGGLRTISGTNTNRVVCAHYPAQTRTGWFVHNIRHEQAPDGLWTMSDTRRRRVACAHNPEKAGVGWLVHTIRHNQAPDGLCTISGTNTNRVACAQYPAPTGADTSNHSSELCQPVPADSGPDRWRLMWKLASSIGYICGANILAESRWDSETHTVRQRMLTPRTFLSLSPFEIWSSISEKAHQVFRWVCDTEYCRPAAGIKNTISWSKLKFSFS